MELLKIVLLVASSKISIETQPAQVKVLSPILAPEPEMKAV